ncbi:MAG: leucine--tRNA ligase [Flavobacteriales bacterium]|nr:leucine--tRNA ligase [Flavobacteriales bacterium]MCW8912842.1 leucine--tRNA ligase [Flavobacteriales bacterium]MCW8937191.1 leucine--tRNA ligase [Flavobacteriales bacterium]MCW8969552.1 leucine--tRNA ligase [Flavobacteriales bacterium]MCW8989869.1 leucine--tRNA ligase [Flavobacteriales bacterium]
MQYQFNEIEKKWQKYWEENKTYAAKDNSTKPKYYVLDMFPYPSGAGLHVGHPLGYIASDIFARYKRLQGYNVLHPMGYDSFGLPAEQYAIQTGQHPAKTTLINIEGCIDEQGNLKREYANEDGTPRKEALGPDGNIIVGYRNQLDKIGFSFDWDREVRTSDPNYYKWTQWIFKQLFNSWYNKITNKAEKIDALIEKFAAEGNTNVNAVCADVANFSADEWNSWGEEEQQKMLMNYRITFLSDTWVNWCPALGTVLANDEIKDGVSERGGHPVEQKLMRQWSMRITAYAERLLSGLEGLDWSESIKDVQRNWIGKSVGASVEFQVQNSTAKIEVFTTRPDTIFGVSFMVLAPEHPLVNKITTVEQKAEVEAYQKAASLKSERDRQSDIKNITGAFTGAFAIHPFTGDKVQIWIGDYVLASYGTGAVMAVPCGDQRDWDFATHFGIEIKNIFKDKDILEGAYAEKDAVIAHSDFLNDLPAKEAIKKAIAEIEKRGIGKGKTQYRLRDAVFSRQRYWGEPFPVYYKNEVPYLIDDKDLPVVLPEVDKYLPTEDGQPPLARAKKEDWNVACPGERMEYNTMPGWAGSSWYFLRYMDPTNDNEFVAKEKVDYWQNVDLYIGGAEHATGHLLYARFWTKFLHDLGYIPFDEPFQKMINQGMIQGNSALVYRALFEFVYLEKDVENIIDDNELNNYLPSVFITKGFKDYLENPSNINQYYDRLRNNLENDLSKILSKNISNNYYSVRLGGRFSYKHSDISFLEGDKLNVEKFKNWNEENKNAKFTTEENGDFIVGREIDKMSKSKYNVQTPDELVEKFGADTLRCYEMFLGPLEQHKPWDTQGITGVHGFLKKLWRLYHDDNGFNVSDETPTNEELKSLHKTIKKVKEDIERFSFNTPVSAFMICVNELTALKCNKREILEPLLIILAPYAPHIAEELWAKLGNTESITYAVFPKHNDAYLVESNHKYPVSFNGKMRFMLELPADMSKEDIEKEVLANEQSQKYLEGKAPKKVIVVPKKIVNVVV